jgi:curved DNA-binding protein CbpA
MESARHSATRGFAMRRVASRVGKRASGALSARASDAARVASRVREATRGATDDFQRRDGNARRRESARAYAASTIEDDPHALLGVARGASADEVKRAYRREALKWHPDRHQGDAKARAEARFKRISAAYQALSAPGGGERRARASGGGGRGGGAEDFARRARAANARRGGETPGGYGYEYRRDFTREDAERVFREMFGNDSSSFIRELERAMREAATRGRAPGFGAPGFGAPGFGAGGFAFGRGMSAYDLNDLFKTLFSEQVANEISETSYVNARGETVIRRVVRSRAPNGVVSESVTERVVGRGGGAQDPWRQQSTSAGAARGARAPPPPGSVVGVNPLVELAVGAARVARIAFVRFVATFGARILQQIIRFILRRIFGGGRF